MRASFGRPAPAGALVALSCAACAPRHRADRVHADRSLITQAHGQGVILVSTHY